MTVLVDSSALYAYLDEKDRNNAAATRALEDLLDTQELVTHNYVAIESAALVHRRLGAAAVRSLIDELLPLTEVLWVERAVHDAATSAYLGALERRMSIVDRVSFEVMRRNGIRTAFCFDRDFARQGFETVP